MVRIRSRLSSLALLVMLVAFAVLCGSTAPARAQEPVDPTDVPAFSFKRLQLGANASEAWWGNNGDQATPHPGHEVEVRALASYSLGRKLFVQGSEAYGTDSKLFRSSLGVTLLIWKGQ